MSQDSNTENNSSEQRRPLKLRKKTNLAEESSVPSDADAPATESNTPSPTRPPLKIHKKNRPATPSQGDNPGTIQQKTESPDNDSSSTHSPPPSSATPPPLPTTPTPPILQDSALPPPHIPQTAPSPPAGTPSPISTASPPSEQNGPISPSLSTAGSSESSAPPPATAGTQNLVTEDFEKIESSHKKRGHLIKAIGVFFVIAFLFAGAVILFIYGTQSFISSIEPDSEPEVNQPSEINNEEQAPAVVATTPETSALPEVPPLVQDSTAEQALSIPDTSVTPDTPDTHAFQLPDPVVDLQPQPRAVLKGPDIEVTRWVDSMHPSGISKNKIFIDGKLYSLGSVVNKFPFIRWIDVDTQLGVLIFEDEYGYRYEKDF